MMAGKWHVLVLAAGRGLDDPMVRAYGVTNKCLLPIGGVPMLKRVCDSVAASGCAASIAVSTEARHEAQALLGGGVQLIDPGHSAPASVIAAIASGAVDYPVLITTGDHALLTPEMVKHFCREAEMSGADFNAGLAAADIILTAYPDAVRTFFRLGPDRVSGCNLFAIQNPRALRVLERWKYLEQIRKKPWRLVAAFGVAPLLHYLTGRLTLARAFAFVSNKLRLKALPIMMPFAEAAIDVDKPADKDLAERILTLRG